MAERVDAGDGWPDFTIPDVGDVGEGKETPSGVPSGPAPAALAEPAPVGTGAPVGEPKTGDEAIPKYRFDEIAKERDELRDNLARVLKLMEARREPEPFEEPDDPEVAKRKKIVADLQALDPRIAQAFELGEKRDVILQLIDEAKQRQETEKRQWDTFATKQLSTVHDGFAAAMSGGKKKGSDLPRETRQGLTDNFVAWVMQDGSGGRANRYISRDEALPKEFLSEFSKQYIEPFRRQAAAVNVTQARRVQNLPVGGGTSSPLGTPRPKPNDSDDEDAVYHRGWADTLARKEAES